jgi:hypothetical protein
MFEVIREVRKRSDFLIRELDRLDQVELNVAAPCQNIGTRSNDRGRWNDEDPLLALRELSINLSSTVHELQRILPARVCFVFQVSSRPNNPPALLFFG